MSDQFSLIDSILNDEEPSFSELGLKKPKQMGDQFKDLSRAEADDSFLKEIGGDSHHTIVPSGRTAAGALETKPVKDATTGDSALADAFKTLGAVDGHDELDELTESEIKNRITFLLSMGHKPSRVAGYMNKLGELKGFDRKQTAEFLDSQAGQIGLAYIEPNFYIKSCEASFDKIKKEGHLNTMSVKKIAACQGCQFFKSGNCGLYCRPIVASAKELQSVVASNLKQKGVKVASTLKATLQQMHEGGARETAALPYHRTEEAATIRTAGDKKAMVHKEASVEEIGMMVSTGIPIKEVYKTAAAHYGKVSAMSAIKRYIAGLK